jgi:hypothetical protein
VAPLDEAGSAPSQSFRARMCSQPSIGRFGAGMWAPAPLPRVEVAFLSPQLQITSANRRWLPQGNAHEIDYADIEKVEAVLLPWWLALWLNHLPPRVGVRLKMGAWRMRLILLGPDTARLLSAFDEHGVKVDRVPVRLNVLWIGRR